MSENKLKVHTLPSFEELSLLKIKDFEHQTIKLDAKGESLKSPLSYVLAFTDREFILAGGSSKAPFSKHLNSNVKGQFLPELWKEDCLELFFSLNDTEEYFEFNLSPLGAWWAEKFASYRKADAKSEMSKLSCVLDYKLTDSSFYSYLKVDFKEYLNGKSFLNLIKSGNLKGNFSGVLIFDGKEKLVSAAHALNTKLRKEKTDFHLKNVRILLESD